jgi:hypothetical protein
MTRYAKQPPNSTTNKRRKKDQSLPLRAFLQHIAVVAVVALPLMKELNIPALGMSFFVADFGIEKFGF